MNRLLLALCATLAGAACAAPLRTSDPSTDCTGEPARAESLLTAREEPPRLRISASELERLIDSEYPEELRGTGASANVVALFVVDACGIPRDVKVLGNRVDPAFHAATLRVVRRLRFEPARLDGAPVSAAVRQRVDWIG